MDAVFLSYARDDRADAEAVANALRATGLEVWWDRHLEGGEEYSSRIERRLSECGAVLVLWSRNSVASPWVRDEATVGRDRGKLVPVSIDGCEPPLGFRQYHTVALHDWLRERPQALPPELVQAITRKFDDGGAVRPAPSGAADFGKSFLTISSRNQEIRFCTAPDGAVLAYSCIGDGPPLVKAANWLNHLEFEWKSPIWRHWLTEFSQDHMLLRYDERGNGLSDRQVADLSFDAFVSDLETVVDSAGVGDFDLIGISQGAAVGIAYAVRHPHRVRRMVLVGGYATGWARRSDPEELVRREAMIAITRAGWGQANPAFRQMFTSLYFPGATREQADSFNELQRVSASPEGAERLQRALGNIDVRHLLQQVQVPTLVFHSRGDAVVPFEEGRRLAAAIPGARFVALDSANHLLLENEPAWLRMVTQAREFLRKPQPAVR